MQLQAILFLTVSIACTAENHGDPDWYRNAIFYQIYPRSFKDSNNDGIGDLRGVIQKLNHLVDIGVTALWLSPIYPSPQKDFGYDISDFKNIDPLFGTMEDFEELKREAHERGLKVVLDFVPNHSSDEHEWFIKSDSGDKDYEDYYVWMEGQKNNTEPPNNWISFFHGSAWKFSEKRQKWYLHQFHESQPDLNYRNPKVIQEMKDILTFWLDKGVDGFRVDAVPSLYEKEGLPNEPLSGNPDASPHDHYYLTHIYTAEQPETFGLIYEFRELLDDYTKKHGCDARIMMTEAYSEINNLIQYFGNETHLGAHFSFNFLFITDINAQSTAKDIQRVINYWFDNVPEYKYNPNWVLGNHDNSRVASRFGEKRVDGLTMLALLLPGAGITYNGEEIGMEDGDVSWKQGQDPRACNGLEVDFDKNSRDPERTPLQWDNTLNAGFNGGHPTWLPVGSKSECNVANQRDEVVSHLSVYKSLAALKHDPVIKYGSWHVEVYADHVLALSRSYHGSKSYVLLVNVGDTNQVVDLTNIDGIDRNLTVEISSVYSAFEKGQVIDPNSLQAGPYEAVVLSHW